MTWSTETYDVLSIFITPPDPIQCWSSINNFIATLQKRVFLPNWFNSKTRVSPKCSWSFDKLLILRSYPQTIWTDRRWSPVNTAINWSPDDIASRRPNRSPDEIWDLPILYCLRSCSVWRRLWWFEIVMKWPFQHVNQCNCNVQLEAENHLRWQLPDEKLCNRRRRRRCLSRPLTVPRRREGVKFLKPERLFPFVVRGGNAVAGRLVRILTYVSAQAITWKSVGFCQNKQRLLVTYLRLRI